MTVCHAQLLKRNLFLCENLVSQSLKSDRQNCIIIVSAADVDVKVAAVVVVVVSKRCYVQIVQSR